MGEKELLVDARLFPGTTLKVLMQKGTQFSFLLPVLRTVRTIYSAETDDVQMELRTLPSYDPCLLVRGIARVCLQCAFLRITVSTVSPKEAKSTRIVEQ